MKHALENLNLFSAFWVSDFGIDSRCRCASIDWTLVALTMTIGVHGSAHKQVPRLRIAIEKANRNAPLGMTDFGEVSLGRLSF
jgi:hypothetical protein